MEMTQQRWAAFSEYLEEVFGREDEALSRLRSRARDASLPEISVGQAVGRLLSLLASMTNGGRGARLALELGTLGGYSGIWIARVLAPGGRLITVESEPRHAAFARESFETAGVSDRVEIRAGRALEVIRELGRQTPAPMFDFVFVDAEKTEYPAYFDRIRPMMAPGGLFVADNILGGGDWTLDQPRGSSPARDAVDALNRAVAAAPDFEAAAVPLREGLLIARKKG